MGHKKSTQKRLQPGTPEWDAALDAGWLPDIDGKGAFDDDGNSRYSNSYDGDDLDPDEHDEFYDPYDFIL